RVLEHPRAPQILFQGGIRGGSNVAEDARSGVSDLSRSGRSKCEASASREGFAGGPYDRIDRAAVGLATAARRIPAAWRLDFLSRSVARKNYAECESAGAE